MTQVCSRSGAATWISTRNRDEGECKRGPAFGGPSFIYRPLPRKLGQESLRVPVRDAGTRLVRKLHEPPADPIHDVGVRVPTLVSGVGATDRPRIGADHEAI